MSTHTKKPGAGCNRLRAVNPGCSPEYTSHICILVRISRRSKGWFAMENVWKRENRLWSFEEQPDIGQSVQQTREIPPRNHGDTPVYMLASIPRIV